MAKNQKQRQKTIEKKRAKRQGRSRSSKAPGQEGLLRLDFLQRCWDREPLTAPAPVGVEAEKFDNLALALLTHEVAANGIVAARFDLVHVISESLHQIFTEELLKEVVGWLYRHAETAKEQQRVLATLQALDKTPWSPYNPVLNFLLDAWFGELPANQARWFSLWSDPFKSGSWPEIPESAIVRLAEADGVPLGASEIPSSRQEGGKLFSLSDIYELLIGIGAVYGWTAGPTDYCRELAAHVMWQWATRQETTPLGRRVAERAPDLHPRWALFQLAEMIPEGVQGLVGESYWDEFVMDPQSPDWVLDRADDLSEIEGQPEDAYRLLQKLAERIPELVEVHLKLAELAVKLEFAEVNQHIQNGLKALEEHGADIDSESAQEYRELLESLLAQEK